MREYSEAFVVGGWNPGQRGIVLPIVLEAEKRIFSSALIKCTHVNYLLIDLFFRNAINKARERFFDDCIGLTVLDHGNV